MSDQTDIVIFKPGRDYSDIRVSLDANESPLARAETAILVWNRLAGEYPEGDLGDAGGHLVEQARAQGAVPQGTPQPQTRTAAPAQASQPSGGGQQFQSRGQRFPLVAGWTCDECGGEVGRKAATGNMSSDAAVCLSKCKDGKYVHTVGWLDNVPEVGTDIDPDDLPF